MLINYLTIALRNLIGRVESYSSSYIWINIAGLTIQPELLM